VNNERIDAGERLRQAQDEKYKADKAAEEAKKKYLLACSAVERAKAGVLEYTRRKADLAGKNGPVANLSTAQIVLSHLSTERARTKKDGYCDKEECTGDVESYTVHFSEVGKGYAGSTCRIVFPIAAKEKWGFEISDADLQILLPAIGRLQYGDNFLWCIYLYVPGLSAKHKAMALRFSGREIPEGWAAK
jgi:hypothetical protein